MFKLTIITITWNNYDQLVDTLNSCTKLRNIPGIKQIVVDTSNNTIANKNKAFASTLKNVKYVRGNWLGISKSYNKGLSYVNSGWIWLLNASDCLHPKLNPSNITNQLKFTTSEMVIFTIEGKQSGMVWKRPSLHQLYPPLGWIPQPGVIMRKSLHEKIGLFNEKYTIALDLEYWYRCFVLKPIVDLVNLPIALCDESGISNVKYRLAAVESIKIILSRLFSADMLSARTIYVTVNYLFRYIKQLLL